MSKNPTGDVLAERNQQPWVSDDGGGSDRESSAGDSANLASTITPRADRLLPVTFLTPRTWNNRQAK
ncbi:hypothetical protein DPMN_131573 [Dreissena polymorpha]|uniref:Uncharacterized protein n=1 Tax=Dreissena polymorpha TaxID=45954 RepID=A0A9D4H4U6_DREPO|nr:hypothetical protein DPMN_131573 [Dreissena polymorpha]